MQTKTLILRITWFWLGRSWLMLQSIVGAYKIDVVRNTVYVLLQIFSGILLSKIIEIGAHITVLRK